LYLTTLVFIEELYKQLTHDQPMQLRLKSLPPLELVDAGARVHDRGTGANNVPRLALTAIKPAVGLHGLQLYGLRWRPCQQITRVS